MKCYLKPFGRGGAVKLWEEKADLINELITRLFIEQPLASPGSAKKVNIIWTLEFIF